MDTSTLSPTQLKVLNYVKQFISEMHYSPTVRDICAGTGLRSTSTVHTALRTLSDQNFIIYSAGARRAISLCECEVQETDERMIQVPLIGNVAAGQPILAVQNIQEYYPLPKDLVHGTTDSDVFMLKIHGDSMIEIGMFEGDMIIVNPTLSIANGEIAVVRIGDSVTVKRFYLDGDKVTLKPENSSMQPIYADANDVEIVGKVVGLIRNY